METVSLKLESLLARKMEQAMAQAHYSTKTEFIRSAIREKISAEEKRDLDEKIRLAMAQRGVMKGKERFKTDEEFYAWRAGEGERELREHIEKKYGIKLD